MWLLEEKYKGVESEAFHADCKRLAGGEPLGYVIEHVPFLDCQIWLDSHPLIPRPETEFWTEHAIKNIKPQIAKVSPSQVYEGETFAIRILDLCAGSGAVGVAVAKAIPEVHVTFAEIDPAHLPTIEKNLAHNLSVTREVTDEQYSFLVSDLFENVPGTFDYILTNPPYIDAKANTVDDSVVENEPHLALFGGAGGMEIIKRIIAGARAKLAPPTATHKGGQLWIEHEPFQIEKISTLANQYSFSTTTHDDQYNTPRYSVLTMAQ